MVPKVSLYFSVIVTPYPLGIFLLLLTIPELMKINVPILSLNF